MNFITVPNAGYVEKRIVHFLYYRIGRNWISTTKITNYLDDKKGHKREHVYRALKNLLNRQVDKIRPRTVIAGDFVYMCKSHGKDFWCLRFDKIPEIEKRWDLVIPQKHKKTQEQPTLGIVGIPIVKILKEPIINKVVRSVFIAGITGVPITREIYIGVLAAKSLYSAWNTLYDSLKTVDQEDIERTTYETAKEASENILTDSQTEIIWNKVKSSIQPEYQDSVHDVLHTAVSKITEGEISIVEQALQSL